MASALTGSRRRTPSAVLGTITAEWAGADRGIGAMMLYALFAYDTPKVWLSVFLTCFLAASGYGIWALVGALIIVAIFRIYLSYLKIFDSIV